MLLPKKIFYSSFLNKTIQCNFLAMCWVYWAMSSTCQLKTRPKRKSIITQKRLNKFINRQYKTISLDSNQSFSKYLRADTKLLTTADNVIISMLCLKSLTFITSKSQNNCRVKVKIKSSWGYQNVLNSLINLIL